MSDKTAPIDNGFQYHARSVLTEQDSFVNRRLTPGFYQAYHPRPARKAMYRPKFFSNLAIFAQLLPAVAAAPCNRALQPRRQKL
jgi:hypothetical protein